MGTPELVGTFVGTFVAVTVRLWLSVFAFGLALYTWPDIVKRAALGATIFVVSVACHIGWNIGRAAAGSIRARSPHRPPSFSI